MAIFICFGLIALVIALSTIFYRKKFQYFDERNIVGPKPGLFGNTKDAFFKRKHLTDEVGKIYEYVKIYDLCVAWGDLINFDYSDYKHKAPFVGFYNFTTPYLLIIDPELAKQIMIKDFKHFRNNEFGSLVSLSEVDNKPLSDWPG